MGLSQTWAKHHKDDDDDDDDDDDNNNNNPAPGQLAKKPAYSYGTPVSLQRTFSSDLLSNSAFSYVPSLWPRYPISKPL